MDSIDYYAKGVNDFSWIKFLNATQLTEIEFVLEQPPDDVLDKTVTITFSIVDVNVTETGETVSRSQSFSV